MEQWLAWHDQLPGLERTRIQRHSVLRKRMGINYIYMYMHVSKQWQLLYILE